MLGARRNPRRPFADWLTRLSIAAAALAVSCGGDTTNGSPSTSCPAVAGCGGDITGLWHVKSMCANASLDFYNSVDGGVRLPPACAALFGGVQYEPIDATIQFTPDGQYIEAGNLRFTSEPLVDAGCLGALGVTDVAAFCSDLDTTYKRDFDTATCMNIGGACQCSVSKVQSLNAAGSYRTQGTALLFDSSPVPSPYCVTGSTAAVSIATTGLSAVMQLAR